ncbi:MAG: Fe-S-containing hydro-lyase [Victivallaceae bacterium]|nr:Fe-S-containing hydro-lyase [Victivallaceae bacterium]
MIKLTTPFSAETVEKLCAGDQVLLSGVVYTGRDAAHKRLCELLDAGKELPVELKDQVLYFVGPSPAKPGNPIGSAGPTTSYRMDAYSPQIIAQTGLRGMIGKGGRGDEVIEAMYKYGCVYFAATGGAAALISKSITSCELVCYEDLGPEAIHRLTVKDLPLIVAIDAHKKDLYKR